MWTKKTDQDPQEEEQKNKVHESKKRVFLTMISKWGGELAESATAAAAPARAVAATAAPVQSHGSFMSFHNPESKRSFVEFTPASLFLRAFLLKRTRRESLGSVRRYQECREYEKTEREYRVSRKSRVLRERESQERESLKRERESQERVKRVLRESQEKVSERMKTSE